MAAKKKTAKKTVKRAAKKSTKAAPKKAVKKTAAKKTVVKKAAKKTAKKAPAKKAVAKKVEKKKTTAKKAAKKTAAKKEVKKSPAKAKKAAAVKPETKKPVQPAQPKEPVKLTGFAKKQYQRLLDLRDSIMDAMNGITTDTLKNTDGMETGGGGMHTGDAGSDAYDRDFALNLLAKEQDSLSEIEQAIERAERGVYGICEMSGERIPNERLEAIPFARYTVRCQEEWEKGHNGRHHSGKGEFGFSNGAMR
ncbi:TraR/DksA family transcriptional regulator [Verrucomicrobiaceae bacterium 5K15]|uniref:TraR/DksA family transcriptional regulator n=1 Tax=Oceaniferula flava TaxID=2800421 RepID=A0AAE2SDS3_9BACT|nr:TraR/DksA family transcriptional regulator [Oceaniferula flavus]MBK1854680.1 TraR/DksA family transcriptional regulator [Oceaniferula flavus]MBM1135986.1 TraR/DksA family transcriptional regulator [Oceaniferula flavus]